MSFIINITNTNGDVGTIEPDVGFSYTDSLNRINKATLKFSGLGAIRKGLLEVGSKVEILRNGTREFFGLIQDINFLAGGAVVANVNGFEIWLSLENGAYAGSPWTATASATIATAIIGESNEFTAGTVETGASIDFRAQNTDSLYNAISNLIKKTQQDIGIDYPNLEIDVLDHKGSLTSVATLNAGIEISNVRIDHFYPKGNIIRVVGSSEGETKITGFAEDATSKTAFGNITLVIRDRTISTTAEANLLADAELAINKDPIKVYDFEVNNFGLNIVSGDVLTLNAISQGISSESVRAVGIIRGIQGDEEFMTLQVTNTGYSRSIRRRNEILGEIEKISRQNEDYNQFNAEYSNQIAEPTSIGGTILVNDAGILYDVESIFALDGSGEFFIIGADDEDLSLNVINQGSSPEVLITGGSLNLGGNKIVNVGLPTVATDVATAGLVNLSLRQLRSSTFSLNTGSQVKTTFTFGTTFANIDSAVSNLEKATDFLDSVGSYIISFSTTQTIVGTWNESGGNLTDVRATATAHGHVI